MSSESVSEARAAVRAALAQGECAHLKIIKIKALNSLWRKANFEGLDRLYVDAVLPLKANSSSDLDAVVDVTEEKWPVWAMLETLLSILNSDEIAAHPQL